MRLRLLNSVLPQLLPLLLRPVVIQAPDVVPMIVVAPEAGLRVEQSVGHPIRALLLADAGEVDKGIESIRKTLDKIGVGVLCDVGADGAGMGVYEGNVRVTGREFLLNCEWMGQRVREKERTSSARSL